MSNRTRKVSCNRSCAGCVQFLGSLYRKDVVKLKHVQWRATKVVRDLEQSPCEGRQRDRAGSIGEERALGAPDSSLLIPRRRP